MGWGSNEDVIQLGESDYRAVATIFLKFELRKVQKHAEFFPTSPFGPKSINLLNYVIYVVRISKRTPGCRPGGLPLSAERLAPRPERTFKLVGINIGLNWLAVNWSICPRILPPSDRVAATRRLFDKRRLSTTAALQLRLYTLLPNVPGQGQMAGCRSCLPSRVGKDNLMFCTSTTSVENFLSLAPGHRQHPAPSSLHSMPDSLPLPVRNPSYSPPILALVVSRPPVDPVHARFN